MTFGEINEDIIQVGSLVQFYFVDFRIKKINWGQPRECSAAPTLNRISGFFNPTLKTREWKRTAFVAFRFLLKAGEGINDFQATLFYPTTRDEPFTKKGKYRKLNQ